MLAHTTHTPIWVQYIGAKQISPAQAYVERISHLRDFCVNTLLGTPGGKRQQLHDSNMYHYINTIEIKLAAEDACTTGDGFEVHTNNIIQVIEEDLNEVQKKMVDHAMEEFKRICLQSFGVVTRGKVVQKTPLPTPRYITIVEESA